LELAEHKSARFPNMENVAIIEDWKYNDRVEGWEYPKDLLIAFEAAGIRLLVEVADREDFISGNWEGPGL
jgi:hypothetical protein